MYGHYFAEQIIKWQRKPTKQRKKFQEIAKKPPESSLTYRRSIKHINAIANAAANAAAASFPMHSNPALQARLLSSIPVSVSHGPRTTLLFLQQDLSQVLSDHRVLLQLLPDLPIPVLAVFGAAAAAVRARPPPRWPVPQAVHDEVSFRELERDVEADEDEQDADEQGPPQRILAERVDERASAGIRARLEGVDAGEEGLPGPPAGDGDAEGADDDGHLIVCFHDAS